MKYPGLYNKPIMLDLDGVIVDFIKGMLKWCDVDPNLYYKSVPIGEWEIEPRKHLGLDMTKQDFWKLFNFEFWSNLEPTPYMDSILEELKGLNITILTSSNQYGMRGKSEWIKRNLPSIWKDRKFLIGPDKCACAHPNSILIDDRDKNVETFIEAGGNAILFPARWNKAHERRHNPVEHLRIGLSNFERCFHHENNSSI